MSAAPIPGTGGGAPQIHGIRGTQKVRWARTFTEVNSSMMEKQRAALIVVSPSGLKKRVTVDKFPFTIGRQADNDLVIRDNRTSRHHARIVQENGSYVLEDLESRHGLFINEERVSRRQLRSSDTISFGFTDSYHVKFTLEEGELGRLIDQFATAAEVPATGSQSLAKLRAVVEVARAVQTSLSTTEVLEAVVDAALAITGSEVDSCCQRTHAAVG